MPLTMFDVVAAVVVFISAFLAMVRGFSREVLSLASWVLAALAAFVAYPHLLPFVSSHISNEMVALIVSLLGIFILALLVISLLTMKVADLIIDSRIGALDRGVGLAFGLGRGILILVVATLFTNELIRPENRPDWMSQAASKPMLDGMAIRLRSALPADLAEKLLIRLERGRSTDGMMQNDTETGGEVLTDED